MAKTLGYPCNILSSPTGNYYGLVWFSSAQGLNVPVLMFVQSKERAKAVFNELVYEGLRVAVMHSDRTQAEVGPCEYHPRLTQCLLSLVDIHGVDSWAILTGFRPGELTTNHVQSPPKSIQLHMISSQVHFCTHLSSTNYWLEFDSGINPDLQIHD